MAMDEDKIVFAITFAKNTTTKAIETFVSCDSGFTQMERIGLLETLKTKLVIEEVLANETTKDLNPANNGENNPD